MANELAEQRAKESLFSFGPLDRKIFLFLVAKIEDLESDEFPLTRLEVKEFASKMGYASTDAGRLYKDIGISIRRMMTTLIEYPSPGRPGGWVICQWIAEGEYHEGEGWYEARLHRKLKPALLSLKRAFFAFRLEHIGKLGSAYAVRLYELAKSREKIANGYFEYDLVELRKILSVPEGKLDTWWNFRKFCLDYAIDQINAETDIEITYQPRKRGRKVSGVLFRAVAKKKPDNKKAKEPKNVTPTPAQKSFASLSPEEKSAMWRWLKSMMRYQDLPNTETWDALSNEDIHVAYTYWMEDRVKQGELFD